MRRLAFSILVLVALFLALGSPSEVEARDTFRRVVVFDSLDVSAQTGDVEVEIYLYSGRGAYIGGLLAWETYTFTTTAGDISFRIDEATNPSGDPIPFVVDVMTDGTIESGNVVTLTESEVYITMSLGMAPGLASSDVDYFVYGQTLTCTYDHNGGDTGYITLILYVRNE